MTNSLDWKLILPEGYEYEVIKKDTSLTARELAYRPVEKKLRALAEEKIKLQDEGIAPDRPKPATPPPAKEQEAGGPFAPSDARFDQSNLVRTQGSPVKIALPVRFLVPTQGAEMFFNKAIIQEHEPNNIAIKFKKVREPLAEWQRNGIIVAAAVLLILLLWLAVRRRSKKRRAGREATP